MSAHIKKSVENHRPVKAEGVPSEESMNTADVGERVDLDPEKQTNLNDPRPERPVPDADRPHDD
ncbi:MAG: hypothetical protein JWN91_4339 [Nocardioides sp.]|jgi:hypothetical protein|nr:hypothetical protein [Nocardioides sp.]